jgi:hypothetical protein
VVRRSFSTGAGAGSDGHIVWQGREFHLDDGTHIIDLSEQIATKWVEEGYGEVYVEI